MRSVGLLRQLKRWGGVRRLATFWAGVSYLLVYDCILKFSSLERFFLFVDLWRDDPKDLVYRVSADSFVDYSSVEFIDGYLVVGDCWVGREKRADFFFAVKDCSLPRCFLPGCQVKCEAARHW